MKNTSFVSNIKDFIPKNPEADTILKCFTDDCKDCSRSYINKLFGHRLICVCQCHNLKTDGNGYAVKTDLISESSCRKELESVLSEASTKTANQNEVRSDEQN